MLETQQFCKPKTSSLCKIDPAAQIVEKKKKVKSPLTWYYNQIYYKLSWQNVLNLSPSHILPLVFLLARISEQDRNTSSS